MIMNFTAAALARIAQILEREKKYALRLSILGGKCAGFAYNYELVDAPQEGDILVEDSGARILIDAISVPFLQGAEMDFISDIMGQSFKINNPNASSSCGCGLSFSVG